MRIRFSLAALALAAAWVVPAANGREPQSQEFTVGPLQTVSDEAAPANEGQPAVAVAGQTAPATGWDGMTPPWHAGYYHTMFGRPVPLVVPPNAQLQTNWGWGIGNTRVTPIYPQFAGPYAGYAYEGMERWQPMPNWPTDTLQFGVYYVRGPYADNTTQANSYPNPAGAGRGHRWRRKGGPAQACPYAGAEGTAVPAQGSETRPAPETVPPGTGLRLRNPYRQPILSGLNMR